MTTRTLTIADAARNGSELPTMHRLYKSTGVRVIEDGEGNRRVYFGDTTPLGKLHRDGKITDREYEAGCIFRADWWRHAGPEISAMDLTRVSGGVDTRAEMRNAATTRLIGKDGKGGDRDKMGPILFACLVGVCGMGETAAKWAEGAGKRRDEGLSILKIALDRMAYSRGLT